MLINQADVGVVFYDRTIKPWRGHLRRALPGLGQPRFNSLFTSWSRSLRTRRECFIADAIMQNSDLLKDLSVSNVRIMLWAVCWCGDEASSEPTENSGEARDASAGLLVELPGLWGPVRTWSPSARFRINRKVFLSSDILKLNPSHQGVNYPPTSQLGFP